MRFPLARRNRRETDLERELRAARPQPRDAFLDELTRMATPVRRARRRSLPKLAFVLAVTALIAVALGVTGALGYAGTSVSAFGRSVINLVDKPHPPIKITIDNTPPHHSPPPKTKQGSGGTTVVIDHSTPKPKAKRTPKPKPKPKSRPKPPKKTPGPKPPVTTTPSVPTATPAAVDTSLSDPDGPGNASTISPGFQGSDPFHRQYGIRIPICWNGHIVWVRPRELVWYLFHGARPARECSIPVGR